MRIYFRWCDYEEASFAQQPSLAISQYQQLPLMAKNNVKTWNCRIFFNRILQNWSSRFSELISGTTVSNDSGLLLLFLSVQLKNLVHTNPIPLCDQKWVLEASYIQRPFETQGFKTAQPLFKLYTHMGIALPSEDSYCFYIFIFLKFRCI